MRAAAAGKRGPGRPPKVSAQAWSGAVEDHTHDATETQLKYRTSPHRLFLSAKPAAAAGSAGSVQPERAEVEEPKIRVGEAYQVDIPAGLHPQSTAEGSGSGSSASHIDPVLLYDPKHRPSEPQLRDRTDGASAASECQRGWGGSGTQRPPPASHAERFADAWLEKHLWAFPLPCMSAHEIGGGGEEARGERGGGGGGGGGVGRGGASLGEESARDARVERLLSWKLLKMGWTRQANPPPAAIGDVREPP